MMKKQKNQRMITKSKSNNSWSLCIDKVTESKIIKKFISNSKVYFWFTIYNGPTMFKLLPSTNPLTQSDEVGIDY